MKIMRRNRGLTWDKNWLEKDNDECQEVDNDRFVAYKTEEPIVSATYLRCFSDISTSLA